MWRGSAGRKTTTKTRRSTSARTRGEPRCIATPLEELTPTQRLGIRSVESRHHTEVTFRNATKGKARLFWLNYWGDEIAYKTLAPGQMHTQQTFETHPWTFATFSDDDDEGETRRQRLVTDGGAAVFWPTRERRGDRRGRRRRRARRASTAPRASEGGEGPAGSRQGVRDSRAGVYAVDARGSRDEISPFFQARLQGARALARATPRRGPDGTGGSRAAVPERR